MVEYTGVSKGEYTGVLRGKYTARKGEYTGALKGKGFSGVQQVHRGSQG
jgi:hypothetical protein